MVIKSVQFKFPIILLFLVLFAGCEDQPTRGEKYPDQVTLKGTVLEDVNQVPVPGVRIYLLNQNRTDTTNAVGHFQFDSLAGGPDTILLSIYNYKNLKQGIVLNREVMEETFLLGVPPCDWRLVEDTSRSYTMGDSGTERRISSTGLYIRFDPASNDTALMRQVALKHGIVLKTLSTWDQQWTSFACIIDGRRPEYFFTPYGKEGFCNFGTEPIVEYCFGLDEGNRSGFDANILIKFLRDMTESQFDSFGIVNGMRLWTSNFEYKDYIITPKAKMNSPDLGMYLKEDSLVQDVIISNYTLMWGFFCE